MPQRLVPHTKGFMITAHAGYNVEVDTATWRVYAVSPAGRLIYTGIVVPEHRRVPPPPQDAAEVVPQAQPQAQQELRARINANEAQPAQQQAWQEWQVALHGMRLGNGLQPGFGFEKVLKEKPMPKSDDIAKITISDLYKYDSLSRYTGLEGKMPIRAGTTFVGVEIELEKVIVDAIPQSTWRVTEDGSLKDNGREFITIPIQFKYLEVELERLFNGLKKCKTSSRCSVHVHLNSRDFTLEELKSFIALYMIFERSLYRFSGDRWNSNFCVPLFFSPHIVNNFVRSINNNKSLNEAWNKYFGLNLSPLFGGESRRIGTIEFRHMMGTTDIKWIVSWINLIVSLKITAKKLPWKEIEQHLETMNTTSAYYWLAKETFKEFEEFITGQPTFKSDIEACITQAKTVFLPMKPVKEEIIIIK